MSKVTFTIGDVNDELSLTYAKAQGFKITLRGIDGDALIETPEDDRDYTLYGFRCNCANARVLGGSYGGHCQHAVWAAQLYPCEACGGTMELTDHTTCFGQTATLFSCPDCGNARDFDLVREERRRVGLGWPKAEVLPADSRKVTI